MMMFISTLAVYQVIENYKTSAMVEDGTFFHSHIAVNE